MAVVAVTFDGTRVTDASATTNWTAASATPTLETDFFYQGTSCVSAQVKTAETGFYYRVAATTHVFNTPKVWIAKTTITNKDALDGNGLILEIGTGTRTAYHQYYIWTAATYPIAGGFTITPIDPNIAAYRSASVGTPNLAAIEFFAVRADCAATSKAPNLGMDAIDYITSGTGLTLVGGDGGDTDGTFTNFITFDESTANNRYGLVSTRDGILYITGVLTIGTATATVFADTNRVLVFPSGRFDTGFCGLDFGLQSATTTIAITSCVFTGRGTQGTNDTRPDYSATGTSGTLAISGTTFNVFRNIDLTSTCTLTNCTFLNGLLLTQSGATISGAEVSGATTADGVAFLVSNDPSLVSDCSFTFSDGHAIQITTAGTYTFSGNTFTGYGGVGGSNLVSSSGSTDAAIYNNSGGLVTLNIAGGGGTPSIRNGAGATTAIVNSISVTLTGLKDSTEIRVFSAGTTTVVAGIEDATAGTADARTFTFSSSAGAFVDIRIINVTYENLSILSFEIPTADTSLPIQQRFDRTYRN